MIMRANTVQIQSLYKYFTPYTVLGRNEPFDTNHLKIGLALGYHGQSRL